LLAALELEIIDHVDQEQRDARLVRRVAMQIAVLGRPDHVSLATLLQGRRHRRRHADEY